MGLSLILAFFESGDFRLQFPYVALSGLVVLGLRDLLLETLNLFIDGCHDERSGPRGGWFDALVWSSSTRCRDLQRESVNFQSEPTARVNMDWVKNPALLLLWKKFSLIARRRENVLDAEMIR